ncbi:GDP-mannose-dependent alpha-mannosyltransferase [Paraliobacillus ryukyuensis]|uniref:Glycosyltransferase involved in cell wall biosynthesis n=1 Tax=Paraliobacillus ryukyuensis TaxID=200904 RepID=A0A366EIP5_9BACI|nr:glycosyltransferase family 1 protein [Paraliobacillus ryukyuensis]RBP01600.1 glycosyltransferase involved in cell wall biosynthesis [Paraliobacillus ryukyuensis]
MKIVIITETFLPSIDGVVTRLTAAIKHLRQLNHEVVVIAPDLGEVTLEGVTIERVKATKLPFYRYRSFALPQRKVKDLIAKHDPDLVHVVNPALVGATGVYYAKKLGYPLIASYHTHVPKYLDFYKLYRPLKPIFWHYFRKLHNMAQVNLCTSKAIQDELIEKNFHNVHLWKRGVDIDKYHPNNATDSMRKRLSNGNPDKKLLLFVGRLAPEKEIYKLKPLLENRDDVRLAIVGDGPSRQELENTFAGTDTVFTGFLQGKELAEAFASSDALVFPSITETLGLVILEAMAAGLPVIAAKSGPTMEQVANEKNGLLFENGNTASMIQAIEKLEDEDLYQKLSRNARIEAEKFSWSEPSQQLVDFYDDLLHVQVEHKLVQ